MHLQVSVAGVENRAVFSEDVVKWGRNSDENHYQEFRVQVYPAKLGSDEYRNKEFDVVCSENSNLGLDVVWDEFLMDEVLKDILGVAAEDDVAV